MKKFSKKVIGYRILVGFGSTLLFLLLGFVEIESDVESLKSLYISLGIVGVALVLNVIYQLLYIKFSGYEITDNEIICTKGVIFRKQSRVLFSKISSVSKKKGLIQGLFGLSTIGVDSNSTNTSAQEEINFTTSQEEIEEIYNILMSKKNNKDESVTNEVEQSKYEFSKNKKFKYALLTSLYTVIIALLFIIPFGLYIVILEPTFDASKIFTLLDVLHYGAICLVALFVISFVVALITAHLKYYQFEVKSTSDKIEIAYGLFVRHTNSFEKEKIKAVVVSTGILSRLFKVCKINVSVVGYVTEYGNQNGQKTQTLGLLVPLCNFKDVNSILEDLGIDYRINKKQNKAKSYFALISWPLLFMTIFYVLAESITVFATLTYKDYETLNLCSIIFTVFYAVLCLITVLAALLEYHFAGISVDDDSVTLYKGCFINYIYCIKDKDIIAVEHVSTPLQKKHGVTKYLFHYYNSALLNKVAVSSQNLDNCKQYESLLKL